MSRVAGRQCPSTSPVPSTLRPTLRIIWAMGCGVLAAGPGKWDGAALFHLATAWLLVDIVVGLALREWGLTVRARAPQATASPGGAVSHSVSGAVPPSPGHRVWRWIGRTAAEWDSSAWPSVGRHGLALILAASLALVLATYLGREPLLAVAAGFLIALPLAATVGSDSRQLGRRLDGLQVSLAWTLGGLVRGRWTWALAGLALLFGLGTWAGACLHERPGVLPKWALRGSQALLLLVLIAQRQPIPAAGLAILALSEAAFLENPARGHDTVRPGRPVTATWLLEMLVVALAAYWS